MALVVVLALAATASLVWANMGIVSYWPFDEGTGTTAYDVVNGNHGTIHGATYTTDKAPVIGNAYALAFDGNDHVQIPNSSNLNIATGSWALWLNFDMKPSVAGHHMNPLAKAEQYWVHAALPSLDTDRIDAIQAKIRVAGTRHVATTASDFIQTGVWYHVVGTYDGETLKLYVDGVLVDSNTTPSGPLDITGAEFAIGTWSYHADYFHGLIDEVGFWDRVLSAEEVAALAQRWTEVQIDIKPGSDPNCINPDGHGVIPVAVLTTDTFDASTVDALSITLEGTGVRVKGKSGNAGSLEDVDLDGDLDLVVHIMDDSVLAGKDTAMLRGETLDGMLIWGTDSICIVPPQ